MNDPWRLDGDVALVTGGGRGIGRECALELARAGATVIICARTETELAEVAATASEQADGGPPPVRPIVADVTDERQVRGLVERAAQAGDFKVLVTAAGTNIPGPAHDYQLADWDLLFDLNVRATFMACRSFGEHLLTRRASGAIVTISSQMGAVGYPGRVAYCATKHAVEGMTKALAVEWATDRIRVNAVAPTFVDTPMTRPMLADPAFRKEVLERRLPTGRLAAVEDVARAVRYLSCEASESVTGHILRVDGGWTAW